MSAILIIDDDDQLRKSFEKLLIEEGYAVRGAPSGEAGIGRVQEAVPDQGGKEAIVGQSRPMQEIYKAIGRVSPRDATVLIRGESGTGKELVARAIYQHSLRASRPFAVINCVAIPENLLESELFGYEKGAFTGAVHRRVGKIEQAHGGTVLLDEIGDMPPSIQAKILRVLQEKSIERLGGRDTISVDVRMIAATNRDLEEALAQGRFREDLYYRLKVVTIWMPALRDRAEDISSLAEYFLARYSEEVGMDNPGISGEAMERLRSYPWPGNVRETGQYHSYKLLGLSRPTLHAKIEKYGLKLETSVKQD